MDEFEHVKAPMAKRGATWRGGYQGEEMELFREVDGEREALIVGYTGKPPHRRWWVDTWDHRRASRGLGAVLEQVEAEYRKTAAKMLRRAEELAEIRREVSGD